MSRESFIVPLKRWLLRLRYASTLADVQFWSGSIYGMNSATFLLGAIEPDERDRLDDLNINARHIREAELRAQGVFA